MLIVTVPQCAALRSQLDVLKKQLDDCVTEKERYHSDLVAAENRAERAQSTTIDLVNRQKEKAGAPKSGSGEAATEDTERKPSSPSVSGSVLINGASSNAKSHTFVSLMVPSRFLHTLQHLRQMDRHRQRLLPRYCLSL